MGFLEHLQSSMILGTKLHHPRSKQLDIERIGTFFKAIDTQDFTTIINMLDQGFDLETRHIKSSHTPLMHALKNGYDELLFFFVNMGSNIYCTDKEGYSLLYYALQHDNELFLNYLIRHHTFMMQNNKQKSLSLELYAKKMHIDTLQAYEKLQSDYRFDEDIFRVVRNADMAALVYSIYKHQDIHVTNTKKQSLLHLAIIARSKAMLLLLLNHNISIDCKDKYGNTPLIYAALYPNRLEFLKLLLARNATINQANHSEHTALTMAIRKHNFKAIWMLLKQGASINIRDGIHTPLSLLHEHLHQSETAQERQAFRELLSYFTIHGAHVDAIGHTIGWTPLQLTINYLDSNFYLKHMHKLIRLGANIEKKDRVGRTPLMLAAGLGREKSVKFLVKHNARLNEVDKYGWSALMLAIYNNFFPIVKYLIRKGADVNLKTKNQLCALKIAQDQKHELIVLYLIEHGATPID